MGAEQIRTFLEYLKLIDYDGKIHKFMYSVTAVLPKDQPLILMYKY